MKTCHREIKILPSKKLILETNSPVRSHCRLAISVTSKKSPNVHKSYPKRISLVKWKILTPLQKLPKMCWWFGQNNCCHGLWKVAQSIINRPIWSHCWLSTLIGTQGRVIKTERCSVGCTYHMCCVKFVYMCILVNAWSSLTLRKKDIGCMVNKEVISLGE